jgi:hypothetical protein
MLEEKCPPEFDTCSLIFSTVKFAHLQTIVLGALWQEVLQSTDEIGESVSAKSDFEVEYVGDPIVEGDFIITLRGIPPGSTMNALQRRYFERITTDFLAEFAELATYRVKGEVVAKDSDGERLLSFGLRGSRRLQSEGGLRVVTTVFGGGSFLDLRTNVLETILGNTDRYVKELSLQQLRPGEINKENSGALFESLQGVGVVLRPVDFGTLHDGGTGGGTGESKVWVYLCIAGIVISVLFLAYRIYRDTCYSPNEKPGEVPRLISGKRPEEDNTASEYDTPDPRSLHHPGVPQSQSRRSLDGPQNRIPSWDGSSAHDRKLGCDGNGRPPLRVASMHNTRPRPPKSRALGSLSDHVPIQPSKPKSSPACLPCRSSNDPKRKPPARNQSSHSSGPRIRAGENGRGVRPIKSMPMNRMRAPPGRRRFSPPTESRSDNAPARKPTARNHSNHSPSPRIRAGGNGQGVRPTKSMPHSRKSSRDFDGKAPRGAASMHNARPTPSESRELTSLSDHGPGHPPKPKSSPACLQSRSNNDPKRKPPARNQSSHSSGPRTRAGENGRGVRPTKSMPMNLMRAPPGQRRLAPPTESRSVVSKEC